MSKNSNERCILEGLLIEESKCFLELLKEERKYMVEEEERKRETKNCQEDSPLEQGKSRVLAHNSPSPRPSFLNASISAWAPYLSVGASSSVYGTVHLFPIQT